MANNDYWAYLRNENELKHYRTKGSKNGYSTNPDYKPIGQIAKGVWDEALGRYEYKKEGVPSVKEFGTRLGSALKKAAGSIKENIRQKQIINRNNKLEAKRSGKNSFNSAQLKGEFRNYFGDGKDRIKDPLNGHYVDIRSASGKKMLEDQAEAASQKRKAALEEEYRNNHRDAQTERPQDAMKKGQEERRAYVAKGVAAAKAVWKDRDKYQKAFDAEGTEHDKPQYDMFRRKIEALGNKYGNDSAVMRETEKWQDELAEEERKRRIAKMVQE